MLQTVVSILGGLSTGIIALLGGLICMSGIIVSRKPNAEKLFNKLIPIQGWIGLFLLFFGLVTIVRCLCNTDLITEVPTFWIQAFVIALVQAVVGFILGYGLFTQYFISKDHGKRAKAKLASVRNKLLKIEIPAGILLALLGLLNIVYFFIVASK